MIDKPDQLQRVAVVETEAQAGILVGVLESHGISAQAVGGFTAGFKAEAPGMVSVMVRAEDAPKAEQALHAARGQTPEVDWSQVDVGQPEDEMSASSGLGLWSVLAWLILLGVGAALLQVIWSTWLA